MEHTPTNPTTPQRPTIPVPPPDVAAVSPGGMGSRLRKLGSESLIYGLSTILGRFLSYLLTPFYARYFGTADNGIQTLAFGLTSLIGVAFILGLDVAYMRNAAAVDADKSETAGQRAFSMSFALIACLGLGLVGLGFLLIPWASQAFGLPPYTLRYMLAIVYTDALLAVPMAHLRMSNQAFRYAKLRLGFVGVSLLLNVGLIAGMGWGIEAIFLANVVANGVVLTLLLSDIFRLFRPALLRRGIGWGALWRYALPLVPATLAVLLVERADLLVLSRMLSPELARSAYGLTPMQVIGTYGFNYKLGVVMLLVVQMFRMAWTPFSLAQAKHADAPRLFARVMTGLMVGCAAVFLATALFLPALVQIPAVYHFPREPEYWQGLPIVPVILLGYVFSGMYAVVTAGLYIQKKTSVLPWIAGAGAVVNVAVCMFAVGHWGMVGVAWATPIAYGLMAALGAWQAEQVYPVPYEWGRLARLALIVGAIYAADRWLAMQGWESGQPASWGIKFALLLAFPLILWVTRFVRPTEFQTLKSMLRRRPAAA